MPPLQPLPTPTIRDILAAQLRACPNLRDVARATAIDVATLSRIANRKRTISGDAVDRLAAHFCLTLAPTAKRARSRPSKSPKQSPKRA